MRKRQGKKSNVIKNIKFCPTNHKGENIKNYFKWPVNIDVNIFQKKKIQKEENTHVNILNCAWSTIKSDRLQKMIKWIKNWSNSMTTTKKILIIEWEFHSKMFPFKPKYNGYQKGDFAIFFYLIVLFLLKTRQFLLKNKRKCSFPWVGQSTLMQY